jgi:hypothetical protein
MKTHFTNREYINYLLTIQEKIDFLEKNKVWRKSRKSTKLINERKEDIIVFLIKLYNFYIKEDIKIVCEKEVTHIFKTEKMLKINDFLDICEKIKYEEEYFKLKNLFYELDNISIFN